MTPAEYEWADELTEGELSRLISVHPNKWKRARAKPQLRGWFVGQVMKNLGGKGSSQMAENAVKRRAVELV